MAVDFTFITVLYKAAPTGKRQQLFMVALYGIGQTIIFSFCGFFFFLFLRRLISAVADWMSAILPHMVWP